MSVFSGTAAMSPSGTNAPGSPSWVAAGSAMLGSCCSGCCCWALAAGFFALLLFRFFLLLLIPGLPNCPFAIFWAMSAVATVILVVMLVAHLKEDPGQTWLVSRHSESWRESRAAFPRKFVEGVTLGTQSWPDHWRWNGKV